MWNKTQLVLIHFYKRYETIVYILVEVEVEIEELKSLRLTIE